MADLTSRRRELRRRKILENSEGRFKKLLGESTSHVREAQFQSVDSPSISSHLSSAATSRVFHGNEHTFDAPMYQTLSTSLKSNHSSVVENKSDEEERKGPTVRPSLNRDNSVWTDLSSRHLLRDLSEEFNLSIGADIRTDELPVSSDVELSRSLISERTHLSSSLDRRSVAPTTPTTATTSLAAPVAQPTQEATHDFWLSSPMWRRIFYATLSIVVYFMLYLGVMKHTIGQSIFLPFTTLEVILFSYEALRMRSASNLVHSQPSLVHSALVLSGVSESVITHVSTIVFYITRFLEELSIFLFTFLFVHWCIA